MGFLTRITMWTSGVLLVCLVAFNDAFFLPGRPVATAIGNLLGRPRPQPQVQPRPMPRPMPIIAVDPVPDEDPCPPRCSCEFANGAISSMSCVGEPLVVEAPPCKVKNCARCQEDNPKKCSN